MNSLIHNLIRRFFRPARTLPAARARVTTKPAGPRAPARPTGRRSGRFIRPIVEHLEERRVLDGDFGFELSGNRLVFAIYGDPTAANKIGRAHV